MFDLGRIFKRREDWLESIIGLLLPSDSKLRVSRTSLCFGDVFYSARFFDHELRFCGTKVFLCCWLACWLERRDWSKDWRLSGVCGLVSLRYFSLMKTITGRQ